MLRYLIYLLASFCSSAVVSTVQAQPAHTLFQQLERSVSDKNPERAATLANQVIAAAKKEFSPTHDSIYHYLMKVGYSFFSNGYLVQSLPWYKQALPLEKQRSGEDSETYQNLLSYVANTSFQNFQFKESKPFFEEIFQYRKRKYQPTDSMYIDGLFQLANNEHYLGDKKSAIEKYRVIKQWYEERKIRSAGYASLLSWFGGASHDIGQWKEAASLLSESAAMYKPYINEYPYYYQVLHQLALVYNNLGLTARSTACYDTLIPFYQKTPGRELDLASAITEMAGVHRLFGRYVQAEEMMNEALVLRKRYNAKPGEIANSYNELGCLYINLGNLTAASGYFQQALALREKHFGKDEVYSTYLHNQAIVYNHSKNYKAAIKYELEAAEIYRKLNPKHGAYMQSLANICYHYINLQQMDEAGKYLQMVLQVSKEIDPDDPQHFETYMVAGIYSHEKKDYAAAAAWYQKAHAFHTRVFGSGAGQVADINRLTNVYLDAGDYKNAFKWQQEKNARIKRNLLTGLEFLSEAELMKLSASWNFTDAAALIARHTGWAEASAMLYDNLLFIKGLALNNNTAVANAIYASGDTTLVRLWNHTNELKKLLYEQEQLAKEKRSYEIDSLSRLATDLEKQLVKRSQVAGEKNSFANASWQTVQQQLDEKSSAIEFVRYSTGEKKTDSALYGALVITKGKSAPVFVPLCSEKQLKKLLDRYEKAGGDLYQRGISIKTKKGISASRELYELVWQPMEQHLAGIEQVFYTPDGLLHRVAFAALPVNDSMLLLQQFKLSQLFSTRYANVKEQQQPPKDLVLAGGIDYNKKEDNTTAVTTTPFSFVYSNRSSEMSDFKFLPGTLQEVQMLKAIGDRHNIRSTIFTGATATETSFRALSGKAPSVIHISTHGFSLQDDTTANTMNNSFTAASDPLIRCGLVMAGGNVAWKTKQAGSASDGILTGKEISTMNLRGCDLAVLSACETGLGNIQGSEGVFGLQRALKTAGVRSVMVSLWPIPDKETVEFMELFYNEWFRTGDKEVAFRHAQLMMRQRYEPGTWAAFVLIR